MAAFPHVPVRPRPAVSGVWPIMSMAMLMARQHPQLPPLAAAPARATDAVFEDFLSDFRVHFDESLATEPAGAAQHIRAYVRALCGSVMADGGHQANHARAALQHPEYLAMWSEFIDELFAQDTVEPQVMLVCRYATGGLWYALLLGHAAPASDLQSLGEFLLALTVARE
ncbi:hypothetical protein [Acidovorax sp. Leaf78]|uniref:hypothetical protein n=1 Tax=Acidovorax sp. Leaf78 TaxID=1736237 RepID=UPI000B06A252|nr:hypothetical protein [Acidovorax sp. Leaf78]